ncbi:MAG: adenylate/guanylate cyclase domain-containing protein [Candidatus Binatia bacterium]
MDIKSEIHKYVPPVWRGLLGLSPEKGGPIEPMDLTILFTDIDDFTAITEKLGDEAAHSLVATHNRIVRRALRTNGGNEVKQTGDGIMAYFLSAARAIQCAIDVQAEVRELRSGPAGAPLRLAMGLNTGAPVFEDGDLYGNAVNRAARITDAARGDQIVVAEVVRLLAAGKGFAFRPLGPALLEGQSEPVPLFEVDWSAAVAPTRVADRADRQVAEANAPSS